MILPVAFLALGASLLFMLWPLIRHMEPPTEGGLSASDQARQRALLSIEEIELDQASGRLSSTQAQARHAEARLYAERVLNEISKTAPDEAQDNC